MDLIKRYRQRVGRALGPSLTDYVYKNIPRIGPLTDYIIYNPYNKLRRNVWIHYYPLHPENRRVKSLQRISAKYALIHHFRWEGFVPRDAFVYDRSISWYPSHMARGKVSVSKKKRAVDCIVEVRDARIPLTSSNTSITDEYNANLPKVVVLNKIDLAPKKDVQVPPDTGDSSGYPLVSRSQSWVEPRDILGK